MYQAFVRLQADAPPRARSTGSRGTGSQGKLWRLIRSAGNDTQLSLSYAGDLDQRVRYNVPAGNDHGCGACGFMSRSRAVSRQGCMPRLQPPPPTLCFHLRTEGRMVLRLLTGNERLASYGPHQHHHSSLVNRRNVQNPVTPSTSAAPMLHMHAAKPLHYLWSLAFLSSALIPFRQNTFDGSNPAD